MKFIKIVFKNLVPTSKKAQYVPIRKISWPVQFREITVYSENHTSLINTFCEQSAAFFDV
jgi:hypothetical protein